MCVKHQLNIEKKKYKLFQEFSVSNVSMKPFTIKLPSFLVRNNLETYYLCTCLSFVNQKNEKVTKIYFQQVSGKLVAVELLSDVLFNKTKQLILFSFL